ncbi:unnamed protein product [Paramecium primaurelia]|uniref:Transmembrane protein n=1 Tax=Paramecium primaurelia TaxID=5886 RepID=A0A8S1KP53_PARPR|nr:unnamed protein product [Paramecium primaurelia]
MFFVIIKNIFYFYILIHSLFSLLIFQDDDNDNFVIQCYLNNHIKELIAGIFKPFLPILIEFFIGIIQCKIQGFQMLLYYQEYWKFFQLFWKDYKSIIQFQPLYKLIQKSFIRIITKLFFILGLKFWNAFYCSGIGLWILFVKMYIIYLNPQNVENYSNDLSEFIFKRQQEILENYF